MEFERTLHLPSKAKLSWRISRLSLTADGTGWLATGWKGTRVAVIPLPTLTDPGLEDAWLAQIEKAFEEEARDAIRPEF